ncbi:dienelactone hydrolase family protein [Bacillus sp. 1P06AnD]|uniref:dienelactone hydrolase family protein n=1 Tax=Bacillus sp. 1P06AnD TaxID=3132208 RepID=UPI0039A34A3F
MIQTSKNSDSVVIIVHEIYGINQHIKNFCKTLSDQNFDVICPNLLDKIIPYDYSQEETAYRHFIENVGFMNAAKSIKELVEDLNDDYKKIFIVGFSVGATVAWLCSELKFINGIVGYYGSRIRNFVDIRPKCSTILFFPEFEPSFNVNELIEFLKIKNIEVHKCKGKHGFNDPFSKKYHAKSSQKAFKRTVNFLKQN